MVHFSQENTHFNTRRHSPAQLEELSSHIKKENPMISERGSGGFGLVNVNMRLRLYYNEPEGLKITSGPSGTEVRFKVPCRTKEEIYENESVSG